MQPKYLSSMPHVPMCRILLVMKITDVLSNLNHFGTLCFDAPPGNDPNYDYWNCGYTDGRELDSSVTSTLLEVIRQPEVIWAIGLGLFTVLAAILLIRSMRKKRKSSKIK